MIFISLKYHTPQLLIKTLYIYILFFSTPVLAQYSFLGADAYGRANSLVAVPNYSSVYHNPSGIARLTHSFLAFNYFKTLPVEGLHTVGLHGVFKNDIVDLGFSADSFGDKYYRESRAGLVLAKKMDKVSIGLKGSYMGISIHDLSSRNTFLGEVGMMVTPSKFFSLGLHLVNFTAARLYGDVSLPVLLSFGGAINPSPKVSISSQIDYPFNTKPVVRFGMNYQIRPELGLATGVNPEMKTVNFGANVVIKKYGILYAVGTHPHVGLAHQFTLIYKLHE